MYQARCTHLSYCPPTTPVHQNKKYSPNAVRALLLILRDQGTMTVLSCPVSRSRAAPSPLQPTNQSNTAHENKKKKKQKKHSRSLCKKGTPPQTPWKPQLGRSPQGKFPVHPHHHQAFVFSLYFLSLSPCAPLMSKSKQKKPAGEGEGGGPCAFQASNMGDMDMLVPSFFPHCCQLPPLAK